MKRMLFLMAVFFFILPGSSQAGVTLDSFQVIPSTLYTDDDVGVLFAVMVKGPERPKEITLIEADAKGDKSRYRWLLLDDGTGGDVQAGDGIYTRKVQFKEKKSKVIQFVVLPGGEGIGELHQDLPTVGPSQTGTLVIKNRPSMIEILGQVIEKIRNKI